MLNQVRTELPVCGNYIWHRKENFAFGCTMILFIICYIIGISYGINTASDLSDTEKVFIFLWPLLLIGVGAILGIIYMMSIICWRGVITVCLDDYKDYRQNNYPIEQTEKV